MIDQFIVAVTEASQVAEVRRQVAALAGQLSFGESDLGRLAILVTEAATNLVKHAVQGEIVVRPLECQHRVGIEILALDKGPGIMNLAESLRDGHSTAGSPGTGLGAMSRLASPFDLHSVPGKGTALWAQLWVGRDTAAERGDLLDVGVVCKARPGETICGDAWDSASYLGRQMYLVADGLGHGLGAASAAREAIRIFQANLQHSPARILNAVHGALRSTRGAVLAIAELDPEKESVRYAGIGNISGVIVAAGSTHHLVSMNGTAGHDVHKLREFSYPFPNSSLLVLHSDGLNTHWNLDHYPGLIAKPPSLIAGVLYRDHQRLSDDVTVLVAKAGSSPND